MSHQPINSFGFFIHAAPAVPSTWLGFEHATQLMIIYIPEN